jgi:hypothetical protein
VSQSLSEQLENLREQATQEPINELLLFSNSTDNQGIAGKSGTSFSSTHRSYSSPSSSDDDFPSPRWRGGTDVNPSAISATPTASFAPPVPQSSSISSTTSAQVYPHSTADVSVAASALEHGTMPVTNELSGYTSPLIS